MSLHPDLEHDLDWGLDRLRQEWKLWTPFERDYYEYWRELALDRVAGRTIEEGANFSEELTETQRMQVALFAAKKVLEIRRKRGKRGFNPDIDALLERIGL